MAIGDQAAALGLPVVAPTADRRLGYQNINAAMDEVAAHRTNANAHTIGQVTGLQAVLNDKAAAVHTHSALNVFRPDGNNVEAAIAATWNRATDALNRRSDQIPRAAGGSVEDGINAAFSRQSNQIARPAGGTVEDGINAAYALAQSAVAGGGKADGPTAGAYGRTASGGGSYAVWMTGPADSAVFGRNVSSARYKKAIKPVTIDPAEVLSLEPKTYEMRRDTSGYRTLGLIAEEVAESAPGLAEWFVYRDDQDRPDALRYEQVLPVALLALCKAQQAQLDALTARLTILEGTRDAS